eukprot:11178085-Lingulodinium_polyedra.AAC.1
MRDPQQRGLRQPIVGPELFAHHDNILRMRDMTLEHCGDFQLPARQVQLRQVSQLEEPFGEAHIW